MQIAPAFEAIAHEPLRLTHHDLEGHGHASPYQGFPTPETTARWMQLMDGILRHKSYFMPCLLTAACRVLYTRAINLFGRFEPREHPIERWLGRCLGFHERLSPFALP